MGALVSDAPGNLYGTTWEGGAYSGGTVFKVDPTGNETVLHVFTGTGGDGFLSKAGLVIDTQGNLYGTTICGGASGNGLSGYGIVFKIDPDGNETVLHSFTGTGGDGAHPYASLVLDVEGNLYGTTYGGGNLGCQPPYGCGTVFKLDPSGNETVLYSFTDVAPDYGANPVGGLVQDTQGNLYGTTSYGGNASYHGNVFKLDPTGKVTNLYNFTGTGGDGEWPTTNLVLDEHGNLYGATNYGGELGCPDTSGLGCGMVFKIDATGKETILYTLTGGTTGSEPSGLVRDAQGNLFGTTVGGGASGLGTVFKLTPVTAATTATLTSSPNPSTYGQVVTFTATVTSSGGIPPNGETVTFMNGTTLLGTGTLSGGLASFTTSALTVGAYSITAVYAGDSIFSGSTSNVVGQVVNKAMITTTLTSSPNPSIYGQAVTFIATVASSGGIPPNGETVRFMNGTTSLGTGTLGSGLASFTTSALTVGAHSITAAYAGDSDFSGSTSNAVSQVVMKKAAKTTATLTSSPNPSIYGQTVTFVAAITSSDGTPPNGETVTFMQGATTLGTEALSGGSASFTTSTLMWGTTRVTAVYGGDSDFLKCRSNTLEQVVGKGTTTTALTSSVNPSIVGQWVTFAATVTPEFSGTVTGKVAFYDGTTLLKSVALSGGEAEYTTSKLTSGAHTITATYNGSISFDGSSGSLTQTVNEGSTELWASQSLP